MPGMKKGLKKLYDDSEALESRLFSIPMDKYTSSGQMDEAGKIRIKLRDLDKAIKKMGGLGNSYEDFKDGGAVKKMKLGGEAVPSKFKGFSKLPEGVQEKINPKLASTYEKGGKVEKYGGGGKVKGGKMSCRGMGAAIKGGGYTIS